MRNCGTRLPIAALLLLSLSSCDFQHRLLAGFIGNRLVFVAEDDGAFARNSCLYSLRITDEAGRPYWDFIGSGSGRSGDCGPWLPIRYGIAPRDSEIVTAPRRLEPGRVYVLNGSFGDSLAGAFRLARRGDRVAVENLDLESDEAVAARAAAHAWQESEARREFEARSKPVNEVVEGPYSDRPIPAQRD